MKQNSPPVGVLLMAHGTPARLEDLAAFYTQIRRGRPPSEEELADLERRYRAIGGTSPLDAITRAQAQGVAARLEADGRQRYRVVVGTRFSTPRIEDAVEALGAKAGDVVVGVVLAPHSSLASVAEYERRARAALEATSGPRFAMVDHWWDAPGFDALVAARVRGAMDGLVQPTVVFTAHSVPAALVDAGDTYPAQVQASADAVAARAGLERYRVAWQSAGRRGGEWLGPDIRQVVGDLAAQGVPSVVVCPIGFVADHLEVLYDIDVEVRAVAEQAGVAFARTPSFNADPEFCALLAGIVRRAGDTVAP